MDLSDHATVHPIARQSSVTNSIIYAYYYCNNITHYYHIVYNMTYNMCTFVRVAIWNHDASWSQLCTRRSWVIRCARAGAREAQPVDLRRALWKRSTLQTKYYDLKKIKLSILKLCLPNRSWQIKLVLLYPGEQYRCSACVFVWINTNVCLYEYWLLDTINTILVILLLTIIVAYCFV